MPAKTTDHPETCYCYECQNNISCTFHQEVTSPVQFQHENSERLKRDIDILDKRQQTEFQNQECHNTSTMQKRQKDMQPNPQLSRYIAAQDRKYFKNKDDKECQISEVTLERRAQGFGFRIVGGTEEGSQVTVGHVIPGGAADGDTGMITGDEILSIDGVNVIKSSHHKVVSLMGDAALRGQATIILRRRVRKRSGYPFDVIVKRNENEGFGFVIISSSNQCYGSAIGKLIPGSPADRSGYLNVGDLIVAVNQKDVAGMSHGDIVQLIKESGLLLRLTIGPAKEDSQ